VEIIFGCLSSQLVKRGEDQVEELDLQIKETRKNEASQKLAAIPGIDLIRAGTIAATTGNAAESRVGR